MEHIAPLIQTVFWVVLIAALVWRFNKPLYELLVALQKRVEHGSNLKVGPFEISEQLKPQNLTAQRKKMESEIHELLEVPPNTSPETQSISVGSLQGRYLQAEDMALRAVQAEYGVPISRQVTGGADIGFDGAFAFGGSLYVVEVRYSFHQITAQVIKASIERLLSSFNKYRWKNTHILIVLVYEEPLGIGLDDKQLSEISRGYSVPILIKKYSFADLEREFGISDKKTG